jgi:hypothetical protein
MKTKADGNGDLEVKLKSSSIHLERRGRHLVAVSDRPMPTLTSVAVRRVLEKVRRERGVS